MPATSTFWSPLAPQLFSLHAPSVPVPSVQVAALRSVAELLTERPEAEGVLLAILVNKLGDSDRKVASKAQYLLSQLARERSVPRGCC